MYPPDRTPGRFNTSCFKAERDQGAPRSRSRSRVEKVRAHRKKKDMKNDQTKMREMERYAIQHLP